MDGLLATLMPMTSIEAANEIVRTKMMENACVAGPHEGDDRSKKLRGNYQFLALKRRRNSVKELLSSALHPQFGILLKLT